MSDTSAPYTVHWTVPVVCTDRGQHKQTPITHVTKMTEADGTVSRSMWQPGVTFAADGSRVHNGRAMWSPPIPDAEENTGVSRGSYMFDCPRCGRHVEVKADRWWAAVRHVVESDLPDIDLSLLS